MPAHRHGELRRGPRAGFREAGEELDVVSCVASGRDRGKFWRLGPDGSTTLVEVPNTYAAAPALEQRAVLLKLHGRVDRSLEREHESFVVTEDDYIGYLARTEVVSAVSRRSGRTPTPEPLPLPRLQPA